jgi:hypothetical protein
MKDLGEMGMFLGCEITRDRGNRTISLSQEKYLHDILEGQGMCECNGVETPLPQGLVIKSLEKDNDGQFVGLIDHSEYQAVVGQILFASLFTRPDLSYAIGVVSRHSHAPSKAAWKAVKHLLRYIKKTKEEKLTLGRGKDTDLQLEVFVDADLGGDIETRKSTTGVIAMMNGGAVSWESKLQKSVALSTMEAEFMALALGVKEALWIKKILNNLLVFFKDESCDPPRIRCDNLAAIALAKNP